MESRNPVSLDFLLDPPPVSGCTDTADSSGSEADLNPEPAAGFVRRQGPNASAAFVTQHSRPRVPRDLDW